jgi:hypothetical protein
VGHSPRAVSRPNARAGDGRDRAQNGHYEVMCAVTRGGRRVPLWP